MHLSGTVLPRAQAELILVHGTLMYEGWVCGPICETYGPFGHTSLSVFISTCQIIFMSNASCPESLRDGTYKT